MSTSENNNILSDRIKRYKARLESITMRGLIEEDKERQMVRIVFEVPSGFAPVYAEIGMSDVMLITPQESGKVGTVQVRRGADYILSMVTVAGLEEDLPQTIHDIVEGLFTEGGVGTMQ